MYKRSVGIAILLAGCANLDFDPITRWHAEVLPVGPAEVSGEVAVAYDGSGSFEAAIALVGAKGTTYGWEVATGSCDAPGARVGGRAAYRDVDTDDVDGAVTGVGSVITSINAPLSPRGRYHARIVEPQDRTTVLACGDLVRLAVS